MAIIYREDLKELHELNEEEFEKAKQIFLNENIDIVIDIMRDWLFDKNGKSYNKDLVYGGDYNHIIK